VTSRAALPSFFPAFLLVLAALATAPAGHASGPAEAPAFSALHVEGKQLLNAQGQPVQLHGVNYSGTEYACIQGWGIFSGPSDGASVAAMKTWNVNAVRIPLNEDCWLGINDAPVQYAGDSYRQAIAGYIDLLRQNGLYAILDLHWSAPGSMQATSTAPMPDRDHAPDFWTSVATTFKGNDTVVFDLFNEPWPDNQDSPAAWTCWRDGGSCSGVPFEAAGMQTLIDAVRATGATNVIALSGVSYGNALSGWLSYAPNDPLGNVVAAWHVYSFNVCSALSCFNSTASAVAAHVPLVVTEIGAVCNDGFMAMATEWLDGKDAGYLAWTWNAWGSSCSSMALISDYSGTPTPYGDAYRTHLATRP